MKAVMSPAKNGKHETRLEKSRRIVNQMPKQEAKPTNLASKVVAEILETTDYLKFSASKGNREVNIGRRRGLIASMKKYGFLDSGAISVIKQKSGSLVVHDGQHRLAAAEMLGIPVKYIIEDVPYDVVEIVNTAVRWNHADYARKWAEDGVESYKKLIAFSEKYSLPVGHALSLLIGSNSGGSMTPFREGKLVIRNEAMAHKIAKTFREIVEIDKNLDKRMFLRAISYCVRIPGFDLDRLLQACKRHRQLLRNEPTCEAFLGMIESVYNYRNANKIPVKFEAEQLIALSKSNKDRD
jgi:hypothetical protein